MTDDTKKAPPPGTPESIKDWANAKRRAATLTAGDKMQIAAEAADRKGNS